MNLFLKSKHWQLFLIQVALPLAFMIVYMSKMMMSAIEAARNQVEDPQQIVDSFGKYMVFSLVLGLLMTAVYMGWIWSIAVGLKNKMPVHSRPNYLRFYIFFFTELILTLAYYGYSAFISPFIFGDPQMMNDVEAMEKATMVFMIMIPFYFILIFSAFYLLYFVAKVLKTIERRTEVTFSAFVADFLLLFIYPIGIWFIQPKVNEFAELPDFDEDSETPPPVMPNF